jgi:hypothetical protein
MVSDPHDTWTDERDRAVWGEHGIASLAATHWLTATAQRLPGIEGAWRAGSSAEGAVAIGENVGEIARIALAPGDTFPVGTRLLRGFARDGEIALRVFDPAASAARGISAIDRFEFDPALRLTGRFIPSASVQPVVRTSVDDRTVQTIFDGVVRVEFDGTPLELAVEEDGGSLFAAFSDATSGDESYGFRFIRLPRPTADGVVDVDFNRAFLPPCAFSDHYVCVLPPPGNRWRVPLRAGERLPR